MTETARIAGLAARIAGEGEPLVLLHGGMGSWNHWTRNVDALAARFKLHLIDLPGCGDSPTVPKDMPDEDYVGLVVAAMDEIARNSAVNLAGFSFGYGGMMCGILANSGMLTNGFVWAPLVLVFIDRARRRSFPHCLVGATAA